MIAVARLPYQGPAAGASPWYDAAVAIELDATMAAGTRPAVDATATSPGTARARAQVDGGIGPGTRLAHFRVERPLGQGGMGEVWLATDLALDRPVALKLLPGGVAGDPARRERMLREARAQARLNHPNVCHIYFIGEDDGRLFFAMEHVAGETLAQRLERGPLPPGDAIELARQAALGLREAHRAGFTHRDVKPSNLMIDGNGMLKVMDFGLVASSAADAAAGSDGPVAASALVGTPLYMAPEQGRGEAVDQRADIYALGATLHHMIAGVPPFAGESAAELLTRHETAARPPLIESIPRRRREVDLIDAVIARMMAKRPLDRYPGYDELIAALDRASPVRTRPGGFWVRSVAAFLDFLVTLIAILPVAILVGDGDQNLALMLVALLLNPLAIARFGSTAGHALLDLEIVDHETGRRPRLRAAMLRGVVQGGPLVLGFALDWLSEQVSSTPLSVIRGVLIAGGFAYGFGELARVSWRTLDKRALWDRVAGTQVRYRLSGTRTSS